MLKNKSMWHFLEDSIPLKNISIIFLFKNISYFTKSFIDILGFKI